MSRSSGVVVAAALAAAVLSGAAPAQSSLEYGNRGNRFEGIRSLPVSGYTAELLSFRVIYDEPLPAGSTPALYRMRFFLQQPASAYVVIREVENKHSYWLDKVKSPTPWGPGFANAFEWSTKDVINQLGLKLNDLGVTVRVGNESPSDLETVAPVVLFHSKPPSSISGYQFAFKTNVTSGLEFSIERSDGSLAKPAPEPGAVRRWSYGVPLRVTWNASNAEAGEYLLKVTGRVLDNNDKFSKTVRFFHQPKLP